MNIKVSKDASIVLTYNNILNIYMFQSDTGTYILSQTIQSNVGDKFIKAIISESNTKIIISMLNSNN
jgi:hypothetical protein